MKKREKFLLAFIISWYIVMCGCVVKKIHTTRYFSMHTMELKEWLYEGLNLEYDNLTEEAKEYFKNEVKEQEQREKELEIETKQYCDENPDFCSYMQTEEYKIEEAALEYYQRILTEYSNAYIHNEILVTLLQISANILILTLIIYSIITLEFKNIKQYIVDSLKLILKLVIFVTVAVCFFTIVEYIAYYEALEPWFDDYYVINLLSMFKYIPLAYLVILIPNIIINVIKARKSKKKNKVDVKEKVIDKN